MIVSQLARENIFRILNIIVHVEQAVHGKKNEPLDKIHFHELNSIDTIMDITTINLILSKFEFPIFYGLPVAIGSGRISFSHGSFQQPAPAVSKLLEEKSYPFLSVKAGIELTTPTGLANLVSIVDDNILHEFPSGTIIKSGIGFGQIQEEDFPNYLKIWSISINKDNKLDIHDSLMILETHLDDVSGEILGMIIDTYSKLDGVKDVSLYPLIMKKNRPGHCLRVLLDPYKIAVDEVSKKIMQDTGTLGIRYFPVTRHKTIREIVIHEFSFGEKHYKVRIKLSKFSDGKIVNIKPEYDDLVSLAKKVNCPIRDLSQKIIDSYKYKLKG
jgi:uncharacterized protein (TIGR00299 family) protein